MTGMTFDDLTQVDHHATAAPTVAAADRLLKHLSRPVTLTVASGGPVLSVGLAYAIGAGRGHTVAVIDTDPQQPCSTITGTTCVPVRQLLDQLDAWYANPAASITPSTAPVDVWGAAGLRADEIVLAHAILARSYPVIVIADPGAVGAGLGDVIIRHLRWTTTAVHTLTQTLTTDHAAGEPVTGRTVIAALDDLAEPGVENQARRRLAAFPVCPIPTDPATVAPPMSWAALRPITRSAFTNLAAAAFDLTH